MEENLFFRVQTPLGFYVRVSKHYWKVIVTIKHPAMINREKIVKRTLTNPTQIRRSRKDSKVFLFYREDKRDRWICGVVKRLNDDGFLITAYPTDTIKEGESIWRK